MNALKYLGFISLVCLAACAPKPPVAEMQPDTLAAAEPPPADSSIPPSVPDLKNAKNVITNDGKTTDAGKGVIGKNARAEKANSSTAVAKTAANSISSWEVSGAMAARSKNKAWSASVNWVQRGASNYQIRLFGPLGSGTVLIQKQGGQVSFRDGPKSASSSNAEQLLLQQTGVRLPVSSLYYWVRGVPAPGKVQSAVKDSSGYLSLLRQAGYTIQYLGYTKAGNAYLPSQIKLQGNGVFIKFIIKRWKV
ncbi:outer membrane lipoprotein LolB [Legionella birminghamensis]|uniref:Outer-membrane lipoprotein LolB n=1 Tax=Legionella birminghamensis TaxID=28083 RepID=A0A378I6R0_9GAMM|nr:lipoprotein insertase outer membrane protein LolB [Legionella birminghamensis]KTC72410.1 outer membrane lipoprotein LolB [Legionella birminghamensis]STX30542.1 outer membrane lipoprotein LolB [Legionella birminghamensis]